MAARNNEISASNLSLSDIIASDEFVGAWRAAVEAPITRNFLEDIDPPKGVSQSNLWDALCTLRRHAGTTCVVLPWSKVDKDVSWYYIPKTTGDDIARLAALGSEESFLGSYLLRNKRSDFEILSSVFQEVVSLAQRDGIDISQGHVGRIWLGAKPPSTQIERVIKNVAKLFYSLERLKNRRLSVMMIEDIHDMLLEGVGDLHIERRRMFQDGLYWPERVNSHDFAMQMLENVVELARSERRFRSPVLISIEMTDIFWDLPVFDELNALTEFLVRRVFFLQHNLGVLSYVPYSATRESISSDLIAAYQEGFLGNRKAVRTSEGLDCSLLYIGAIQTYLSGARDLEDIMRHASERNKAIRHKLDNASGLNDRQKGFVVMAATRPGYSFTIKDYESAFSVVYSTARSDLIELAERGYLVCKKKSRNFTFRIQPKALEKTAG